MSIHRSLRTGGALSKHRNVLTRTERLAILQEDGRWTDSKSVLGLPKVRNIKLKAKKKAKKEGEGEAVEGAEAAAAPAAAPAGKPAGKPA
ncbi:MAG: small basic protein [Planctomycetota bacterium]|nr:small basic protein [Planctomycetota bacterium]